MTSLNDYLTEKRAAVLARKAKIEDGTFGAQPLTATVSAEGRSGVRRIRIRGFQVLTDGPPDFAGYDLGPSSPELQLGVLGSCLAHSYLIQAAVHQVSLDSLEVEVTGTIDARAAHPAYAHIPVHPHDLAYVVRIVSPASAKQIARLEEAVDKFCPILNLLRRPQTVAGTVELKRPSRPAASGKAAAKAPKAKPPKQAAAKAARRPSAPAARAA